MTHDITVAVAGCGYWGMNLVRVFNELGALRMICDPVEANRDRALQTAPKVSSTAAIEDVLAAPVQGVVLATPAETHFSLARRALEAGKDVFVEKPLALTHREGSELVALAERLGRVLMVGHVLEYHPGVVKLHDLVRSGALGELRYVYSNRLSLGKVRREENALWSFAPHDIAVTLRLMGSDPISVAAAGGNYLQPKIADVTVTNLLFGDGARAHIFVSWLHPFKEQRLVAIGSKKMASFDDVAKELVLYDQHVEFQGGEPIPVRGPGEKVAYGNGEPLKVECAAFLEAVATRRPPLTDGRAGLRVLDVLEAAQWSLATEGIPVSMPHTVRTSAG